ncbi:hypothetical protein O9992_12210 [Vibrio lentus]|nr:hypothetical protein [Vibrio lentus]
MRLFISRVRHSLGNGVNLNLAQASQKLTTRLSDGFCSGGIFDQADSEPAGEYQGLIRKWNSLYGLQRYIHMQKPR